MSDKPQFEVSEQGKLLGETPNGPVVAPHVAASGGGVVGWAKRVWRYLSVMYPVGERILVAVLLFFEIYFISLLNHGVRQFSVGVQELVGAFTVFSFLMWLRVADDFKDYELDCRLFADRPLPAGEVSKRDLIILMLIMIPGTLLLNLLLMPNFWFCLFLYTYGSLMAVWFFQKHRIQPSLPLALFTHNPVQIILNIYVLSFTIIKYHLPAFDWMNFLAVFTLYFPALIWEVTRKIRAPQDETSYTTYSKLFGYKKATTFAEIVTWMDILTNFALVWNINRWSVLVLLGLVLWMTWQFEDFKRDPTRYKIVDKVLRYTFLQEFTMIATVVLAILFPGLK
ncbi:MAG: hypothetical protein IJI12_04520 [Atopobiaceae bacterium]|nr:hypothetical protein [Atopobiaceae bacterium]